MEKKGIDFKKRFENVTKVTGIQKSLDGDKDIEIREYKNIKEKRELKKKILDRFNGQLFRSIITPREIDKNVRLNKLERDKSNRKSMQDEVSRSSKFSSKTKDTISTFPSVLTMAYVTLLTKERDKVFDAFMGHNSRAEDVLSLGRRYFAYDVHHFPVLFTHKAIFGYSLEDYDLNLGSSEKVKYEDESMDFSITCPPYFDVEPYNKIYEEELVEDLSSKKHEDFLFSYYKCLKETYRVLKKDAHFVIVVGDSHTKDGYRSLMLETIKICKMCGFTLKDINIYNRKSNIGGDLNYKQFILKSKRFPTIHEFILIFKK